MRGCGGAGCGGEGWGAKVKVKVRCEGEVCGVRGGGVRCARDLRSMDRHSARVWALLRQLSRCPALMRRNRNANLETDTGWWWWWGRVRVRGGW